MTSVRDYRRVNDIARFTYIGVSPRGYAFHGKAGNNPLLDVVLIADTNRTREHIGNWFSVPATDIMKALTDYRPWNQAADALPGKEIIFNRPSSGFGDGLGRLVGAVTADLTQPAAVNLCTSKPIEYGTWHHQKLDSLRCVPLWPKIYFKNEADAVNFVANWSMRQMS